MRSLVDGHPKLAWRSPTRWESSAALYVLSLSQGKADEVAHRLFAEHGVVVRPFSTPELELLRVSPNLANDVSDLERLVAALDHL